MGGVLEEGLSEETDQILFVNWVHREWPEVWPWLHHSPNGGKRNKREAARFKLMGVRKGFPDLTLWVGVAGFSGLAIEMKIGRGRPTAEQKKWLAHMRAEGWAAEVATLSQAKQLFTRYMKGEYLNETEGTD